MKPSGAFFPGEAGPPSETGIAFEKMMLNY
jgi:hypothetical protein